MPSERSGPWDGVEAFLRRELPNDLIQRPSVQLAAVGTVAAKAIANPSLERQIVAAGSMVARRQVLDDPGQLHAADWSLAIILSPHKRSVARYCDEVTPTAGQTTVIDTLLRVDGRVVGVNTNAFAAAAALRAIAGPEAPRRVLLIGTGATARSIATAVRHVFPEAQLGIVGRSSERTADFVRALDGAQAVEAVEFQADVMINATTVGETSDAEDLPFPFDAVVKPERRFLDVNNRTSRLQISALQAGCAVMSGIHMQTVVNQLRAAMINPPPALHDEAPQVPAPSIGRTGQPSNGSANP